MEAFFFFPFLNLYQCLWPNAPTPDLGIQPGCFLRFNVFPKKFLSIVKKFLLCTYCVPETVLGARDPTVTMVGTVTAFLELTSLTYIFFFFGRAAWHAGS